MPLPESNLPPDAQKWRRAIEKDLAELKKAVGIAVTNLTSTRARFTGVASQAASVEQAVQEVVQEVGEVADEANRNDRSSWEPKPPENPRHNQRWFDTTDGNIMRVWIDHGEYRRINYALNPNFSEGTENWTLTGGDLVWQEGFDPHADLVATADDSTLVLEEVQGRTVSLELEETEDDEDGEGGSEQSFVGVPWSASANLTAYSDNLDVTAVLEVVDTNDNVLASSGPVVLPVGQVTVVQAPSVLDEYEIVGAKVRLTVTGVDEGDYVSLDKIMLEAIAEPEEDYFDGDMPGVTWETLSQGTVSVWSGEPDWYVLQDDNLKQELYDELEGLDADLTDLHETVLPNLRDRLDDAEDALAPLPGQVAAAVQTAADAEAAALAAAGIAEGKGQVITQISPPTGSRARAENLWVRLPDHKVHIYDEGTQVWVPATDPDLIAAANEAATARQEAQAAQSAAQAAQDAADALGTALATVEGDLATAQGLIDDLEDDVTVAATTAAVENLYVTGTGAVNELVANAVWAAKVAAQKVLAHEVLIGGGENLIPNGAAEMGDSTGFPWVTYDTEDKPDGERAAYWAPEGHRTTMTPDTRHVWDVEPGAEYHFGIWLKADRPESRMYIELRDDETNAHAADCGPIAGEPSGAAGAYPVSNHVLPTEWTYYTARVVPRPGVRKMRLGGIYYNHSNGSERDAAQGFAGMRLRKRIDHSLIVDGGVLARHITASEEMSAKLAEFLKVRVGQIIGDEAGFDTAVVNQLWADMFAARKLTAEEADLGTFAADEGLIQQLLTHNVDVAGHLSVQGSFAAENNDFALAISPVGAQLIAKQSLPETPDHSWIVPANGLAPRDVDGTGGRLFISSSDYPTGTTNQRNHLREWSQDGAVLWERMSPTNLRFSRIRAAGDHLVGHMRRLDGDIQTTILVMDLDGNETSRFVAGTTITDIFDVSEDGLILTGSQGGPFEPVVVSIYDTSGTLQHSWPSQYAPAFSGGRGVIEGGLVHIYGGSVIETYTLDGAHVRSINVGDVSSGLRVEDGVLFASTGTGRIQGYEAATGTPRFAWTLPYTRAAQFTFQGGRLFTTPSASSVPSTGEVFRMDRFDVGAVPAVQAEFSTVSGRLAGTGADFSGTTNVDTLAARTIISGQAGVPIIARNLALPEGWNRFSTLAEADAVLGNAPQGVEIVTTLHGVQRWIRASRQDGTPGVEWVRVWSEEPVVAIRTGVVNQAFPADAITRYDGFRPSGDTLSGGTTTVGNYGLCIPLDGWYRIEASMRFDSSATAAQVRILVNDAGVTLGNARDIGATSIVTASTTALLGANDVVDMRAYSTSANASRVWGQFPQSTMLSIQKL